tara:strand:+ start:321 stop:584 length:264 start_codon:yes stop_codon:yes gene_type:complete
MLETTKIDPIHLKALYNNFILSNANKYEISIESLFKEIDDYLDSDNFFLPDENAQNLEYNTLRLGVDFCPYIVKIGSDKKHYWKRIS